jgi:uncharacterized protein YceK
MKKALLMMLCLGMGGCGTLSTVGKDNYSVGSTLLRKGTSCTSMPRIYSGVGYNLCKMNSKSTNYGTIILGLSVIDTVLSAALDTAVLHYTIYTQNEYGSFELREHIR